MNTKEQIEEARKNLKKLEAQLEQEQRDERIARQKPLRKLAEKAHHIFCAYNHTDGCGWGYEECKDEEQMWECWSHQQYLQKVEGVMKDLDLNPIDFDQFLDKLKEIKKEYPRWRVVVKQFYERR